MIQVSMTLAKEINNASITDPKEIDIYGYFGE